VTYSINGRQFIAIAAGGGPIAALGVGLTPEADTSSGTTPCTFSRYRNSFQGDSFSL